jgi:hypothetical protein
MKNTSFSQKPSQTQYLRKVYLLRLLNMGCSGRGHVVFGTKTRLRRQRNHVYTVGIFLYLSPPPGGPARGYSTQKPQTSM